jgi:tetratricopeptide (TPR) repeat protein
MIDTLHPPRSNRLRKLRTAAVPLDFRAMVRPSLRLALPTLAALTLVACGASRSDRADRDRALADAPVRGELETEPLRGDLLVGVQAYRDGDLRKHVEANPRSAAGWYELGLVEFDRSHPDKARPLFEKALALNPQLHGAASNLGVLYLEDGEDVAALRALEQALELAPDDARVLANLGAARLRRGLWSEAIEAYQKAVALQPGHASLLYDLALAWLERNQFTEAQKALDDALLVRPKFALARAAKVVCLQGLGDLRTAEAYARESLSELSEPVADNRVVLARVLIAQRKAADALEELHKALDLDEGSAVAQLALAELLDATGKKGEAIGWYSKFLKNPKRNLDDTRRVRDRLRKLQDTGTP